MWFQKLEGSKKHWTQREFSVLFFTQIQCLFLSFDGNVFIDCIHDSISKSNK
jgi:hypothetical protein